MRNHFCVFQLLCQQLKGVGSCERLQVRENVNYPIILHERVIPN